MLELFKTMEYHIFFWTNEVGEYIHVHISRGGPTNDATKIWIASTGDLLICHNKDRIPKRDLKKICSLIRSNVDYVKAQWISYFGEIKYYC